MKITFFGLAITSSWGNGHATTYRALAQALHARGHEVVFYEKDLEWYASNRDMPEPPFCKTRIYSDWNKILPQIRRDLRESDVAVVGSYVPDGVRCIDEVLASGTAVKAFYDIDTPITVEQLRQHGQTEYLKAEQIPGFDIYFSFTGGPALTELEKRFGARRALPLYCSVDASRYKPLAIDPALACDMSYMGTYAPDRQPKLEAILNESARQAPEMRFIVAGPQYPEPILWPKNVRRIMHLEPKYHPLLYSSSRLTLNLTRRDMVMAGHSPSVRLFEAAACGAAIVSDNWPGLEGFFEHGREILLAASAEEVLEFLRLPDMELRRIGEAARARVLAEHASGRRAEQFETAVMTDVPTAANA